MNAQTENWNDLHLVLAITRDGGLSGAARTLGVHHATVLRRLNTLEHSLGVTLFERSPQGYRPTINGEELAALAAEMEEQVVGAFRRVAGKDLRLSGTLRIATADYLAVTLLPGLLRQFREVYPDIELELTVSTQLASLTKRDADVAIRPTNTPPENLIGRHVCDFKLDTYRSKDAFTDSPDLSDHSARDDWIVVDDSLPQSALYKWRHENFRDANGSTRINSLLCIFEAAKAGLGTAILPCFMADPEPLLIRTPNPKLEMKLGLWLLTHPDLLRTQRVKVFMKFAASYIQQQHGQLGISPP